MLSWTWGTSTNALKGRSCRNPLTGAWSSCATTTSLPRWLRRLRAPRAGSSRDPRSGHRPFCLPAVSGRRGGPRQRSPRVGRGNVASRLLRFLDSALNKAPWAAARRSQAPTALLHYYITTLLNNRTTTLLHCYTTALPHYYTCTLRRSYATTLPHYYTATLPTLPQDCTTTRVHYYPTTPPPYHTTTLLHILLLLLFLSYPSCSSFPSPLLPTVKRDRVCLPSRHCCRWRFCIHRAPDCEII